MPASYVVNGVDLITAEHYNALLTDVRDVNAGHTHTGSNTDGKQVSHADLADGVIQGRTNSHAALDSHVAAMTAHGQPATAFLIGHLESKIAMVSGQATVASSGNPATLHEVEVTTTLTTVLNVILTPTYSLRTAVYNAGTGAVSRYAWGWTAGSAANKFKVWFQHADALYGAPTFSFLAFGTP